VQVTQTAVGTNTSIQDAIPNGGSGIKISGHAHDNAIGGFQPSIEPQVTVSANRRYGIEIGDAAHHNVVFHTYIGTDFNAKTALGNDLGGILLGPGTSSNTIGGESPLLANKILNSAGRGVTIRSSHGNAVLGNEIQGNAGGGVEVNAGRNNLIGSATAGNTIANNGRSGLSITGLVTGTRVVGNKLNNNAGDGVLLEKARRVTLGGTLGTGNRIIGNQGFGLFAKGACTGSVVQSNVIEANAKGNVDLTNSRGILYIP
jgi:hypothetical protein